MTFKGFSFTITRGRNLKGYAHAALNARTERDGVLSVLIYVSRYEKKTFTLFSL